MIFKDIDIKKLFALMQEHDVDEITLKDGKTAVEVKRNKGVIVDPGTALVHPFERAVGVAAKPVDEVEAKEEDEAAPPDEESSENYHIVEAPLVGTFYRASAPDVDPFVEVGDRVKDGDVLCIVEAMKSMNEIQADVSGVIKEICIENAGLVEFEQPLFKIESSG